MPKQDQPKRNIHAEVTSQIIAAIEADPGNPPYPGDVAAAPCTCR